MKYFAYLEQQSKQMKTMVGQLSRLSWSSSAPEANTYVYGKPLPPYNLAYFWGEQNHQNLLTLERQAADLYHSPGSLHEKNILVAARLYIDAAKAALKYTNEARTRYAGLRDEIEIRNFLLYHVSHRYDSSSGAFARCITWRKSYEAFHPFTYLPNNYEYQPFVPLPHGMTPSSLQTMFEPFFDTWIRAASFGLIAGAWSHIELKTSNLNSVNETLRQYYPQQANALIEAVLNKATNELHTPAMILLQLYTLALGNLQIDLDKPNPPNLDIISIGFYLKIMKIAAQISEELYVIEDYIRQISDGKMELSMVLPELRAISNNIMSADLFDAEEFIAIEFVEKFVKGQLAKQHEMQDKILQRMRYLGYGRILDALGASDRAHIASGFFEEPVNYAGKQQVQHPSTLRKRKLSPGAF